MIGQAKVYEVKLLHLATTVTIADDTVTIAERGSVHSRERKCPQ